MLLLRCLYTCPRTHLILHSFPTRRSSDLIHVTRYKGLGEMNPEQLWETTMNPATRTLLRVNLDDAAGADEVFDMLMGDQVPPRKKFIQTHAKYVRNLDA